jgi:hypothetical protein
MTIVGYCIISCVRGLIQRLIKTTLTKQISHSYQNNILLLDTEQESQLMLGKFEEKNC